MCSRTGTSGFCLWTTQPVYGLQAKGLDGGEPLKTIEEMAAHYVKEIRELHPHGPYFMGGLSFGGIVAFEMARQLTAVGQKVGLLAVLDTGYEEMPNPNHRSAVVQRASFLLRRVEFHVSSLRQLRRSEKLAYFRKKINTIGAAPAAASGRCFTDGMSGSGSRSPVRCAT